MIELGRGRLKRQTVRRTTEKHMESVAERSLRCGVVITIIIIIIVCSVARSDGRAELKRSSLESRCYSAETSVVGLLHASKVALRGRGEAPADFPDVGDTELNTRNL